MSFIPGVGFLRLLTVGLRLDDAGFSAQLSKANARVGALEASMGGAGHAAGQLRSQLAIAGFTAATVGTVMVSTFSEIERTATRAAFAATGSASEIEDKFGDIRSSAIDTSREINALPDDMIALQEQIAQLGNITEEQNEELAKGAQIISKFGETSGREAAEGVFRLMNLTKESIVGLRTQNGVIQDQNQAMEFLLDNATGVSSALLEVAAGSAAGADGMIQMLRKLQAVGSVADFTTTELIALAGTITDIDEGIREKATSSIVRLFTKRLPEARDEMQDFFLEFAEGADEMTRQIIRQERGLERLFDKNPMKLVELLADSFTTVADRVSETGLSLKDMRDELEAVGLTNIRDAQNLAAIGSNLKKHSKFLDTANQALEDRINKGAEHTELMKVNEELMKTFEGRITALHREFDILSDAVGGFLADQLTPLVSGLKDAVMWLEKTRGAAEAVGVAIAGITLGAGLGLLASFAAPALIGAGLAGKGPIGKGLRSMAEAGKIEGLPNLDRAQLARLFREDPDLAQDIGRLASQRAQAKITAGKQSVQAAPARRALQAGQPLTQSQIDDLIRASAARETEEELGKQLFQMTKEGEKRLMQSQSRFRRLLFGAPAGASALADIFRERGTQLGRSIGFGARGPKGSVKGARTLAGQRFDEAFGRQRQLRGQVFNLLGRRAEIRGEQARLRKAVQALQSSAKKFSDEATQTLRHQRLRGQVQGALGPEGRILSQARDRDVRRALGTRNKLMTKANELRARLSANQMRLADVSEELARKSDDLAKAFSPSGNRQAAKEATRRGAAVIASTFERIPFLRRFINVPALSVQALQRTGRAAGFLQRAPNRLFEFLGGGRAGAQAARRGALGTGQAQLGQFAGQAGKHLQRASTLGKIPGIGVLFRMAQRQGMGRLATGALGRVGALAAPGLNIASILGLFEPVLGWLGEKLDSLADEADSFRWVLEGLAAAFEVAAAVGQAFNLAFDLFIELLKAGWDLITDIPGVSHTLDLVADGFELIGDAAERSNEQMESWRKGIRDSGQAMEENRKAAEESGGEGGPDVEINSDVDVHGSEGKSQRDRKQREITVDAAFAASPEIAKALGNGGNS